MGCVGGKVNDRVAQSMNATVWFQAANTKGTDIFTATPVCFFVCVGKPHDATAGGALDNSNQGV